MRSSVPGSNISDVEVAISRHGIRPLSHGKELFRSCDEFFWFKDQTVKAILNVQEPRPGTTIGHTSIDLTDQMIQHPERFPMLARR